MKKLFLYLSAASFVAALFFKEPVKFADEKKAINTMLNNWHAAAARADGDAFFGKITEDGIYIGTDATENWDKKAFIAFAKPYFDKGRGWEFKVVERNIYFSKDGKTAWFDELLDTWMKACRGSGVLEKQGKEWKIKHYVLSMTVPNDVVNDVLPHKGKFEDELLKKMGAEKK